MWRLLASHGMSEPTGISAALRPFLDMRRAPNRQPAERVHEELVAFLDRRGWDVDEVAGRRVALAPLDALEPSLAWRFVADHLITRAPEPPETLCRMARLLARAVRDAGRRGLVDRDAAHAIARAALRAAGELPRLDRAARSLRRALGEGRPGRALYEENPEAYARAMQRWESQLPLAEETIDGSFRVVSVDDRRALLQHHLRSEAIEIELPREVLDLLRPGDRLELEVGRNRTGWFVRDAWHAAAPEPKAP
jgi:hypothetical protein